MIKSGLSSRTVTRYLPAEFKAKPRGFQVSNRDKMSLIQIQNHSQNQQQTTYSLSQDSSSPLPQSQQQLTNNIEQFSMADRYHYRPEFISKVIDHLAKIYNEKKTGQKITVIFRKVKGGSSNGKANKNKKYQPLPDEVEQRRQKVLLLVKKGVLKIGDLVKQSGVSESAVRRYLEKAGYKIKAGTVSLSS